jgi:hypothetical protein
MAFLSINTGGALGGIGFLKVDAAFSVRKVDASGCPCEIIFYLSAEGGPTSHNHSFTVYNRSGDVDGTASGAATLAFPLPTGNLPQHVRLFARIANSAGAVEPGTFIGIGAITAIWVPFGATSGNTLSAALADTGEAGSGLELNAKPDEQR